MRDSVSREQLKLCICGFGGAGKSQLLLSLQDKQSVFLTKDNPRSLTERTPGVAAQNVLIGGCKFSALDFGGQPEFYLTHHMFLAQRDAVAQRLFWRGAARREHNKNMGGAARRGKNDSWRGAARSGLFFREIA